MFIQKHIKEVKKGNQIITYQVEETKKKILFGLWHKTINKNYIEIDKKILDWKYFINNNINSPKDVLDNMGLDIYDLPVCPFSIAEKLSVKIKKAFPNAEYASYLIFEDENPVIYINMKQPITKQRFFIAHALGHLLCGEKEYKCPIKNDKLFSKCTMQNLFAVDLLVPALWIKTFLYVKSYSVKELADVFGVSKSLIKSRLDFLGYSH